MADSTPRRGQQLLRSALRRLSERERTAAWVERLRAESERALDNSRYGAAYYRAELSADGYGTYSRPTSNADKLATMAWSWLDVRTALDVGCAAGFVVEALCDLGISTTGVDLSAAAFDLAAPHIRPKLSVVDLRDGLPHHDDQVELLTAFETLEHLRPADVPAAVSELARVSSTWVVVSIPSFGPNPSGPPGWFEGKVRHDRLDDYRAAGDTIRGPLPADDLAVDADGRPVKGHLTIAPYSWWTDRFAEVGLTRCPELELQMNLDLARYGLIEFVCLYVLRHDHVQPPSGPVRSAADISAAEKRHGLTDHDAPDAHVLGVYGLHAAAGLELRPGLEPPVV